MADESASLDVTSSAIDRDGNSRVAERWRGNRRRRSFLAAANPGDAPEGSRSSTSATTDEDLPVLTDLIDPAATVVAAKLPDAVAQVRTELAAEFSEALARQFDDVLPSLLEASLHSAVADLRKGIVATIASVQEEFPLQRGQDRRPRTVAGENPEPPTVDRPGAPPYSEEMGDPL